VRRPILIDLILHPDDRIERGYYVLKKDRDLLIIETDVPQVKGQKAFLWAKASPLYDSRGNIVVLMYSKNLRTAVRLRAFRIMTSFAKFLV